MEAKGRKTTPENQRKSEMVSGFHWCLKPLEFCARVTTGVSLGLSNRQTLLTRISGLSLGLLILLSNLYLNGPRSVHFSFKLMEERLKHESAWSFLIDQPDALLQFSMDIGFMLLYLSNPLVHIIFLIVIFSSRWTQLKYILNRIQNDMRLSGNFHRKCRKKCLFCLLIMITDATVFIRKYGYDNFYVADEKWQGDKQENLGEFYKTVAKWPFPFLAAIWARMTDICLLILYAGLSCLAAQIFVEIEEKASEITEENSPYSHSVSSKLEEIRSHCELASILVQTIDYCFGLILLVNTAKAYATSIFEFGTILRLSGNFNKMRIIGFSHTVIRFFVIIVPSFYVAQTASGLSSSMAGFSSIKRHTVDVQFQTSTVLLQVSTLPAPVISALEVVHLENLSQFLLLLDTSFQYGATLYASTMVASRTAAYLYMWKPRQESSIVNQFSCPNGESFLPCHCYSHNINCLNVTMKEIQRTFKFTTPFYFGMIDLRPRDSSFIPKDIFGQHRAELILIGGDFLVGNNPLEIQPQAFGSSRNLIREFVISFHDLKLINFGFLADFKQLETFQLWRCTNISLLSVPFLPRLQAFVMIDSKGINDLFLFPKEINAPQREGISIELCSNELNDKESVWILDWLYTKMMLAGYNVSFISLSDNRLTKFSSISYKKLLEWMHDHHSEFDLIGNPFDCSDVCELAWLIKDNRHLLLPTIGYYQNNSKARPPTCSNGTSFVDLSPVGLQDCPAYD